MSGKVLLQELATLTDEPVTYSAPYTSFYPACAEDSALSFLHIHRVPPPGLAKDYLEYICTREGIHPLRAKLYISNDPNQTTTRLTTTSSFTLIRGHEKVELRVNGCGFSKANPIVLFLDIDPTMDRTLASQEPSALEKGGKRVAKAVRKGCGAVQSVFSTVFGALQKVPSGME